MGEFKQKNGKTRVGRFLQNLGDHAKPIADVALNIASDVTGIKQLENIADMITGNTKMSVDEKEMAMELLQLDIQEMKEVTKRWESDMTSDSWLSKNVRPLTLVFLLVVMTILVIGDSIENSFVVKEHWVSLIQTLLATVVIAYFGSRGVEKFSKITKKR